MFIHTIWPFGERDDVYTHDMALLVTGTTFIHTMWPFDDNGDAYTLILPFGDRDDVYTHDTSLWGQGRRLYTQMLTFWKILTLHLIHLHKHWLHVHFCYFSQTNNDRLGITTNYRYFFLL